MAAIQSPPAHIRMVERDGSITKAWFRYLQGLVSAPIVTAPTLLNSWTNVVNEVQAGFYKDSSGVVHLQGHLVGGALGTAAFVLPAGSRPPALMFFATTANNAFAQASVDSSGNVVLFTSNAVRHAINTISFLATQ